MRIAYYITPHGFGHAVRSLEVIRHLLQMEPKPEIILVSDLPELFVRQNVGIPLPTRQKRLDVGLVQSDSVRFDLEMTLDALYALHDKHREIVSEEVAFLTDQKVTGVVADIPFLAIQAASRCGIPVIGIGNFTWDWIYKTYAQSDDRWAVLIKWIREGYSLCDLFLQLPMHGDCSACPRIRDVPLVARRSSRNPEETRSILGCNRSHGCFLISFTALDLAEDSRRYIESIDDVIFYYKHPLRLELSNGHSVDNLESLSYVDLVAAVDGVITKPGYGIVSDCLVHGTPVIYTDRGIFAEYEILVHSIRNNLTSVYIPSEDLYAGSWEWAIREIGRLPRRIPKIRSDGAHVCARLIMEHMAAQ